MSEIELDQELLADFIVESRELLDEYTANVIELERNPGDADTIGAIFRAAHTLKGSSAFFNLTHIKNFAHKLENLLDDLRNRVRSVTPEVIDYLLGGGNPVKAMFERVRAGDIGKEQTEEEDRFLSGLLAFMAKSPLEEELTAEAALMAVRTLTEDYRQSGRDPVGVIEEIEALTAPFTVTPEESAADPAPTDTKPRDFRYFCGDEDLTDSVLQALAVLDQAAPDGDLDIEAYDDAVATLEARVTSAGLETLMAPLAEAIEDYQAIRDSGMDFDPLLVSLIREKMEALVAKLVRVEAPRSAAGEESSAPAPADGPPAKEPVGPEDPAPAGRRSSGSRNDKAERKTMRIDEDKVDGFMNYVGELIVTAESFNYLQKMIEAEKINPQTVRAFKNANQAFRELSGELQESLMEIRRVPIKGLLQKVNMMARELSAQVGKKVRVEMEGQDVQVDKSIAESLEGPLVHVVRNSLDHGLETPEERERNGKSPEGFLCVRASAEKEHFHLEVTDDGQGIDPAVMRRAAMEKGLISQSQADAMSDKEAVNLIFGAGFSTAKTITDVSGRGVGMDVVQTNIGNLNGSIGVDSTPGRGTTISLKIPLSVTLQVVRALLVRIGGENYIISLDEILESLRPMSEELSTVEGRGEVFIRRGRILPLIRLYKVFNVEPECTEPSKAILVVVETALGEYGLMVDEVLGQQQVVVKELGGQFKNLEFIAGSATLGDGRMGLVLDAEGVVRLAHGRN